MGGVGNYLLGCCGGGGGTFWELWNTHQKTKGPGHAPEKCIKSDLCKHYFMYFQTPINEFHFSSQISNIDFLDFH